MFNNLKSINNLKWKESPIVNFYTDFDDLVEEKIDEQKICLFHIKVNLEKETQEEIAEMKMATDELVKMGIINPKNFPEFFKNPMNQNRLKQLLPNMNFNSSNDTVKTSIFNANIKSQKVNLQHSNKKPQINLSQQKKSTLLDEILKQRNPQRRS